MRTAVGRTVYTLRVAILWILGVAAGTIVLLVLVVGAVLYFTRPPSAESEVRRFLAEQAGEDVVAVDDCKPVRVDSSSDVYRCELRIAEQVRIVDALGDAATLGPGASTRCFSVPRSTRSGSDEDPWLGTC